MNKEINMEEFRRQAAVLLRASKPLTGTDGIRKAFKEEPSQRPDPEKNWPLVLNNLAIYFVILFGDRILPKDTV